MSERELIETALSVPRRIRLSVDTEVIEDAARQYLASLDGPPVPQEGVSEWSRDEIEEAATWVEEELKDIPNTHAIAGIVAMLRRFAPLLEKNARLKARIEHWEKTADHHWSARQKLQRELNVVTELYNAGRGAEARVKELEEGWHLCHAEGKLTDPIAVHINMLRGTIAKPSVKNIIHLYGREALLKELCEEGFVVVPREPTEGMIRAGNVADCDNSNEAQSIYTAMLAAIYGKDGK